MKSDRIATRAAERALLGWSLLALAALLVWLFLTNPAQAVPTRDLSPLRFDPPEK